MSSLRRNRTFYLADDAFLAIKQAAMAENRSTSCYIETWGNGLISKPLRAVLKVEKKDSDEGFDDFWRDYPKKYAKEDAKKAWAKLEVAEKQAARASVKVYRFPAEAKFIPYPATWLNGKRWLDTHEDDTPKQPAVADWEKAPEHVREAREKVMNRLPITELEQEMITEYMEQFR